MPSLVGLAFAPVALAGEPAGVALARAPRAARRGGHLRRALLAPRQWRSQGPAELLVLGSHAAFEGLELVRRVKGRRVGCPSGERLLEREQRFDARGALRVLGEARRWRAGGRASELLRSVAAAQRRYRAHRVRDYPSLADLLQSEPCGETEGRHSRSYQVLLRASPRGQRFMAVAFPREPGRRGRFHYVCVGEDALIRRRGPIPRSSACVLPSGLERVGW